MMTRVLAQGRQTTDSAKEMIITIHLARSRCYLVAAVGMRMSASRSVQSAAYRAYTAATQLLRFKKRAVFIHKSLRNRCELKSR
jgi:hypothetical protein